MPVVDSSAPGRPVQADSLATWFNRAPGAGGSIGGDASTGAWSPRSAAEPAAEPPALLDQLRKPSGATQWEERTDYLLRGRDCRCGCCASCSGKRGHRRAEAVAKVVESFGHWRFLTLTIDGSAFAGKQREIYEHLRESVAVGELMRSLRLRGLTDRWFCCMEFQGETQQVHFHLIVETLTPTGFLDARLVQKLWGRFRPEWAGELGKLPNGDERPGVGFANIPTRRRYAPGKSAVVAYVTGYLGAAGKNPVPDWWLDSIDERHGKSQMYSCSRNFWAGFRPAPKPRLEPLGIERPRRRPIRERMKSCREQFDIIEAHHLIKDGKIINTKWKFRYRSKSENAYWNACALIWPQCHPDEACQKSGGFIDRKDLSRILRCSEIETLPRPKFHKVAKVRPPWMDPEK